MKKIRIFAIFFLITCVVSNIKLVSLIIDHSIENVAYRFSNIDRSFYVQAIFLKTNFSTLKKDVDKAFADYIFQEQPPEDKRVVYRLFSKNPIKFWRWFSYFTDDIYDYPYLDPKLIERE